MPHPQTWLILTFLTGCLVLTIPNANAGACGLSQVFKSNLPMSRRVGAPQVDNLECTAEAAGSDSPALLSDAKSGPFSLHSLEPDVVGSEIGGRLSNKDRVALMLLQKTHYDSPASTTLRERFQALRPSVPNPFPTDCPPAVANALLPDSSFHFDTEESRTLDLNLSTPRTAQPLTKECLKAVVAEFQRPDSLFSHIQTLRVYWGFFGGLELVDVPAFQGLWSEIQVLLDNPPPSLTTLDIPSELLTGVSMGKLRRLVLNLSWWDPAHPVNTFLRAAAPQITSLVLKKCGSDAPLAIVLTALQQAPLKELTIDGPAPRIGWQTLWDSHPESLRHLTHFKFRHNAHSLYPEDMSGLWTRVICHPGLVAFEVNWRHKLEDLDLRRTTECIVNNPSLRKFVASQVTFKFANTWLPRRHAKLRAYFAAVANHPALEEWSVPGPYISRYEDPPSKQIAAHRKFIKGFRFPRLRTLWWSNPIEWPDSFPNVRKLVVSVQFLNLVAKNEKIRALPPALDALEVAEPLVGQLELDWEPESVPPRAHRCQVKAFVYSISTGSVGYTFPYWTPSIPLSSLAAEESPNLRRLGKFVDMASRVMSTQMVNGLPIQAFNDFLSTS